MTIAASDRELILELLRTFKQRLLVQDIDRLMSLYSETFFGQGMTKRALREALAAMKANGGLSNLKVSIDLAAIDINDGVATVSPVFVSGSTATYTIAREGSSWFISAMEEAVFVSGDASLSTKLILIEGLPGSGKSTVANDVSFKLTEFGVGHYSYLETSGKKPIKFLDPLSATYRRDQLAQWEQLVAQSDAHTIVLESAFWQTPVDAMIGNNYPRAEIVSITDSVNSIVEPLMPKLIYFCHADVDSHIRWIFNSRGEKWAGEIIERDLRLPYHRDRGHSDISGIIEFFEDCQKLTDELYDRVPFQKTKIRNPHQDWERVRRDISRAVDRLERC